MAHSSRAFVIVGSFAVGACTASPPGFDASGDHGSADGGTAGTTEGGDDDAVDDAADDDAADDAADGSTGGTDTSTDDDGTGSTDDDDGGSTGAHEPMCGDGVLDDGEACDDGNLLVGDGCSHRCAIESEAPTRVFVTSALFSGAMGGLAGADASCQDLADDEGLGGTWLAWLSDGVTSPSTRFAPADTTYALVDGTPIADDWQDLTDGTLQHAIDRTQSGGAAPVGTHTCGQDAVWSNVTAAGGIADAASHCNGWTATDAIQSHSGRYDLSTDEWSASCYGGGAVCLWSSPIYCFEQ